MSQTAVPLQQKKKVSLCTSREHDAFVATLHFRLQAILDCTQDRSTFRPEEMRRDRPLGARKLPRDVVCVRALDSFYSFSYR